MSRNQSRIGAMEDPAAFTTMLKDFCRFCIFFFSLSMLILIRYCSGKGGKQNAVMLLSIRNCEIQKKWSQKI